MAQTARFKLSIRWKLLIPFVFIVVLAVGVLLPITTRLVARTIEDEADQQLVEKGQSVVALIESSERQAVLSASFVANLPEVHDIAGQLNIEGEALSEALLPRKEALDLQELSFFGADYQPGDAALFYGGPVSATRLQVSANVTEIRDRLIAEAINSGLPTSGIAIAPQSSQVIGVSPVTAMGSNVVQGIVVAVFFINDPFIAEISDILGADIALVTNNAPIASTINPDSGYELILQQVPTEEIQQNIDIPNEGQQRLLAVPLVLDGQQQGSILIAQSIEDLVQVQKDIQTALIVFAGAVTIASILFALVALFNFARPLTRLVEATHEVSMGNLDLRVEVATFIARDEISELGENFNVMTERLQDLYTSLEQQVQERTRELVEERNKLDEALRELAIARDRALEASRAKSTFLANMSHELRTPLNAIIGYSEMLEEDAAEFGYDDFVPDLNKIHSSGRHLLQLINNILDLSKIEAGKMELYLETFSLKQLVDDVATTIKPLIDNNNNTFKLEIDERIGSMYADVTKVRQTLFNLLSNASKFTENGTITLKVAPGLPPGVPTGDPEKWIIISVKDSGIGMSEEQMARLFQEFSQADASTTRKYGGTGLGLALTMRICQMMGGDIAADSVYGEGSVFTLWLPVEVSKDMGVDADADIIVAPEEAVEATPAAEQQTTTVQTTEDGRPVVLVIDDDPSVRDMMKRYLNKEGYNVATTESGMEGLKLAKELRPIAITLDVMMPGMDGWTVLSQLKEDPELSDIPVIMMTIVDNKNMGFALGAADYMTKPVDRERLMSILHRFGGKPSSASVLIIEDDEASRQMMRRMLEEVGCLVNEAENGRDALEQLAEVQPTLILLDLMMPEMDGFQFIAELRKLDDQNLLSVPIVVVTAKDLTQDDLKQLNGYVEKVIQKGDLLTSRDTMLNEVREMLEASLKHSLVS